MSYIFGTDSDDDIEARAPGDTLSGLAGNDRLTSRFDRTVLRGDSGRDTLTTDVSYDDYDAVAFDVRQFGGEGADSLSATTHFDVGASSTRLHGGPGSDSIRAFAEIARSAGDGGPTENIIYGGGADDDIGATIAWGNDDGTANARNMVWAGWGDDVVSVAAEGSNTYNEVRGADGNDTITADARSNPLAYARAENLLYGGAGNDIISASAITQTDRFAGDAFNTIYGGSGNDTLSAEISNDLSEDDSSFLNNELRGGDGNDHVYATISAPDFFRELSEVLATNKLYGANDDDVLTASVTVRASSGAEARNELYGGGGDDRMSAVADALADVSDPDSIHAALAFNELRGGGGNDRLVGEITSETGRSVLHGGTGDDDLTVRGGAGNVLHGGAGSDTMRGSEADDTFVFDLKDRSDHDVVKGFERGQDRLAFAGITDRGAPGLVDDLDAIASFGSAPDGDLVIGLDAPGAATVCFAGIAADGVASFADLVDDPGSQLIHADRSLFEEDSIFPLT